MKDAKIKDIVHAIGKGVGISKQESRSILEDVKANLKRLRECKRPHDFQELPSDRRIIQKRYRCTKCGGEIRKTEHIWYQKGLEDGKL
jgi:hypothetical protein